MGDTIRVTILVENTAFGRHTRGEHGLAFWIVSGDDRVLFDTGQSSDVLLHNADFLGIDLTTATAVVLSHGHYDHTGGLEKVMERAKGVRLFAHPGALSQRFSRLNDGSVDEIGLPPSLDREGMRAGAIPVTWTPECTEVTETIRVTGAIPRRNDFEDAGGAFFLDGRCDLPDPIEDDQAIFFDTAQGTVVLLGCAHSGIINTLRHVQDLTDRRPLSGVLGGMHLVSASEARLDQTIEALREMEIGLLVPLHCTGPRAQVRLASEFPSAWEPSHVGSRFEFLSPPHPAPE